jgi:hypothetical protein
MTEVDPSHRPEISDEALRQRLSELGLPDHMLDRAVSRIRQEHRANFFDHPVTLDNLDDALKEAYDFYEF